MFDIIVADSATNVKPIININNSLKKYIVIFFTIYPLHIETLKVLEKLIKINDISMLNTTLTINPIYVKC